MQQPGSIDADRPPTVFSLVIPVYKNEGTIEMLIDALSDLHVRLDERLEVVFVVDGSPDRSYDLLHERLQSCSFPAELVGMSRNFGSFAAIRMGLTVASGPYFAVMAADLQEPPELVESFFRSLIAEPVDVVVGVRTDRDDPLGSRLSSSLFWAVYRHFVQREMPAGGVDVFGCNVRVRDALLTMDESNSSLVGQLIWLGFRRKAVPYARLPRKVGKSGWTFMRKVRYMFDSILSFTSLPVTMVLFVGGFGLVFSVILAIAVLWAWSSGRIPVPGYTPIILVLLFSMFSQLTALGLIGTTFGARFENTKRRPPFVPMLQESFRKNKDLPAP